MIKIKLTNQAKQSATVFFDDCLNHDEPVTPVFSDPAFNFPWDSIPNEYGHMGDGKTVSPNDFFFKAAMFGFIAELIDDEL